MFVVMDVKILIIVVGTKLFRSLPCLVSFRDMTFDRTCGQSCSSVCLSYEKDEGSIVWQQIFFSFAATTTKGQQSLGERSGLPQTSLYFVDQPL